MSSADNFFVSFDGVKLFRRQWLPAGRPRGVVCLIHGAFEHSGRFKDACAFLCAAGYRIESFDLRGHGMSEGEITPQTPFLAVERDIGVFVELVKQENPGVRPFLLGQSLGGALALMYASEQKAAEGLAGVILCAPACRLIFPPLTILVMYALGKLLPGFKVKELEAKLIARDPAIVEEYENDPLVNRQGIPLRPLNEFIALVRLRLKEFVRRDVPLLIFHGTADKIVDIRGSRELYHNSVSRDKRLEKLPCFYHDLLNDPGRERIFRAIVSWLGPRR